MADGERHGHPQFAGGRGHHVAERLQAEGRGDGHREVAAAEQGLRDGRPAETAARDVESVRKPRRRRAGRIAVVATGRRHKSANRGRAAKRVRMRNSEKNATDFSQN